LWAHETFLPFLHQTILSIQTIFFQKNFILFCFRKEFEEVLATYSDALSKCGDFRILPLPETDHRKSGRDNRKHKKDGDGTGPRSETSVQVSMPQYFLSLSMKAGQNTIVYHGKLIQASLIFVGESYSSLERSTS